MPYYANDEYYIEASPPPTPPEIIRWADEGTRAPGPGYTIIEFNNPAIYYAFEKMQKATNSGAFQLVEVDDADAAPPGKRRIRIEYRATRSQAHAIIEAICGLAEALGAEIGYIRGYTPIYAKPEPLPAPPPPPPSAEYQRRIDGLTTMEEFSAELQNPAVRRDASKFKYAQDAAYKRRLIGKVQVAW